MGLAHHAPPRVSVDTPFVAACSFLRVLHRLWLGADFPPGLVAPFLVQHPLWIGTAPCLRPRPLLCGSNRSRRSARVQVTLDPFCRRPPLLAGLSQCLARPS